MKSFKILLVLCLFACVGLSFTVHPSTQAVLSDNDPDPVYTQDQATELLTDQLTTPLSECIFSKNDQISKCWYGVRIKFVDEQNEDAKYTGIFCAEILVVDCSRPESVGFAYIDCENKTVEAKESFRSPRIGAKKYIKSVCKFFKN